MKRKRREESRFPSSIFFVYLFVLLLMTGIHTGILTWMEKENWNDTLRIVIVIGYWTVIAGGLTIFTRYRIRKTYDIPVKRLAEAAGQVAKGDFSVYVETVHTAENKDYLDKLIDDFNKMVAELGSIETLKTDFFTNVSHEFKTPLAAIQNNAMLLNRKDISEKERMESAEAVIHVTRRLTSLITNMLRLNKLEKQAILPETRTYDLSQQLCDCIIQFDAMMEKKKIDFEADLEDRTMIIADESLMEMVWNNLMSNALKFTPENGSVKIRQYTDSEGITVAVEDTGCGMDEKTQKKIFEKFYQGDTSHATEGNGLGLALVLRILNLMDCSITVESEPDKGSTFIVHIPVERIERRQG